MSLDILGFPIITYAKIGTVEFDVSLSEDHIFRSDITENPVEDGSIYSDNIVLKPFIFEFEGRISDASQYVSEIRGPGRSADGFKELVSLQNKKALFEVKTGIAIYKNMTFKELSVPRVSSDGRSIRFNATIQELLIIGEDSETNRDRIADDVKNTALPSSSNGMTPKVPA